MFWGRYELLEVGLHPCVEPTGDSLHVGLLNHAKAIEFRDRLISARLRALGVRTLMDFGCDFGSLLASSRREGIISIGFDADEEAVASCQRAGLEAHVGLMEEIVKLSAAMPGIETPTAISIINVLHGDWRSHLKTRLRILKGAAEQSSVLVISAYKNQFDAVLCEAGMVLQEGLLPHKRFPTKVAAQLMQYGRTFFLNGRLGDLEGKIWAILSRQYRVHYEDKFTVYSAIIQIWVKSTYRAPDVCASASRARNGGDFAINPDKSSNGRGEEQL